MTLRQAKQLYRRCVELDKTNPFYYWKPSQVDGMRVQMMGVVFAQTDKQAAQFLNAAGCRVWNETTLSVVRAIRAEWKQMTRKKR